MPLHAIIIPSYIMYIVNTSIAFHVIIHGYVLYMPFNCYNNPRLHSIYAISFYYHHRFQFPYAISCYKHPRVQVSGNRDNEVF